MLVHKLNHHHSVLPAPRSLSCLLLHFKNLVWTLNAVLCLWHREWMTILDSSIHGRVGTLTLSDGMLCKTESANSLGLWESLTKDLKFFSMCGFLAMDERTQMCA